MWRWHSDAIVHSNSLQVADFLLSPELDHLAWVAFAMPITKSELSAHIPLSILEDQDRCFENLYCVLFDWDSAVLVGRERFSLSYVH